MSDTETLGPWIDPGDGWERRYQPSGKIAANATRGDWWAVRLDGSDDFGEADGIDDAKGQADAFLGPQGAGP